jgi:hypothetical protein
MVLGYEPDDGGKRGSILGKKKKILSSSLYTHGSIQRANVALTSVVKRSEHGATLPPPYTPT